MTPASPRSPARPACASTTIRSTWAARSAASMGRAIRIGAGSSFTSIRNNLFTQFVNISTQWGRAVISAPEGQVSSARVTSADYNAFYSPNGSANIRYLPNIVSNPPGDHDVQANPQLAGASEVPYRISEGCLWQQHCTTGQVLSHYREVYRPTAGQPADRCRRSSRWRGHGDRRSRARRYESRGSVRPRPRDHAAGPDTQPPAGSIAIETARQPPPRRRVT